MDYLNTQIKKYRKAAGLKQTDMAERLEMKLSTYSQMEREGIISAKKLYEICEILNVTPCTVYMENEPCRQQAQLPLMPIGENAAAFMHQPEIPPLKKELFIVTKKEEGIIKLLRKFNRTDYEKVIELIEEINRNDNK